MKKEQGFVAAANFSLKSALKELAISILDAQEIVTVAEKLGRKVNDQEVEVLDTLEESCENLSMIWAQYKEEVLDEWPSGIEEELDDE